jgi:prevent-host-death family protein
MPEAPPAKDVRTRTVSDLRAHLSEWLERAREGEEVVVTERGVPVARLLPGHHYHRYPRAIGR